MLDIGKELEKAHKDGIYTLANTLFAICYKAAETHHKMYMECLESASKGDKTSLLGAAAYFEQKAMMYRYEIPSIIHEAMDELDRKKMGNNNGNCV